MERRDGFGGPIAVRAVLSLLVAHCAKAKKGGAQESSRPSVSPAGMQYNVVPSKSLGPFILGMQVGLAIKKLSDNYLQYKLVNFVFSDMNPLSLDLVLDLANEGIQLRFDPVSQRLKFIDVYDPKRVTLSYGGALLSAAGTTPVMSDLYHKIGPSTGQYDTHQKVFVLKYPGLSLFFPVPSTKEHKPEIDLTDSFAFSDGSVPTLANLCVHFGSDCSHPGLPPLREPVCSAWAPHYFQEVLVSREGELEFTMLKKKVRLADNCQDVLLELGPPDDVFFKTEDKMRIHSSTTQSLPCADYIYNYFGLGIDILFDCLKHTAKKIVLHTNQPAHFDFNRYTKCNFRLQLARSSMHSFAPAAMDRPSARSRVLFHSVVDTQPGPVTLDDQLMNVDLNERPALQSFIGPDSKWDEVTELLPSSLGKPVKLPRPPLPNTVDPFGHTLLYHHAGLIFEVLRNNHIATVTISQPIA